MAPACLFTFLLVTIFSIPPQSELAGSKGNLEEMSSAERNSCDQLIASTAQAFEANKEKISTTSGKCCPHHFSCLKNFS